MSKPILTLPCKQNLQTLEKRALDYYCNSCDKVLTDFRGKTDSEIEFILANATKQICGIMHPSQIDYKRSNLVIPRYQSRIGLSLLGILGLLGPVMVSCEENHLPTSETKIKKEAFNTLHFPLILRGTLTDRHSSDRLGNSEIELVQNGTVIRKEKTNEKGEFEIKIQEKDLNNEAFELTLGSPDTLSYSKPSNTELSENNGLSLNLYAFPAPISFEKIINQALNDNTVDIMYAGFATAANPKQPLPLTKPILIDQSSPYSYKSPKLNFEPKKLD